MFTWHIILFTTYIILFTWHIILFTTYIILFPRMFTWHIILFTTYIILGCLMRPFSLVFFVVRNGKTLVPFMTPSGVSMYDYVAPFCQLFFYLENGCIGHADFVR